MCQSRVIAQGRVRQSLVISRGREGCGNPLSSHKDGLRQSIVIKGAVRQSLELCAVQLRSPRATRETQKHLREKSALGGARHKKVVRRLGERNRRGDGGIVPR